MRRVMQKNGMNWICVGNEITQDTTCSSAAPNKLEIKLTSMTVCVMGADSSPTSGATLCPCQMAGSEVGNLEADVVFLG